MWPFDHTFGTYGWPGPFGWVAHNCPGNVAAGFIQVALAAAVGTLLYPPTRRWIAARARKVEARVLRPLHDHVRRQTEHNAWVAQVLADAHMKAHGVPVPDHPHFGDHHQIVSKSAEDHAKHHLGAGHPAYADPQ